MNVEPHRWVLLALLTALVLPNHASAARRCFFFCSTSSGYTETQHPIVLAHGWTGFDSLFGVFDYFHDIEDELEDDGATVYVTAVSPANTSEFRGEELIEQLDDIRAITGRRDLKFNLIGHSQGGLDSRYVHAVRPDLVASITTVGTLHKGSGTADFVFGILRQGSPLQVLISAFGNLAADVIALLSGTNTINDADAALFALTSQKAAQFNAAYPAGVPARCGEGAASQNGVRFYSWGGASTRTNILDLSDPLLALTGSVIDEPNDGLVGRCSNHFGDVLRDDYRMNHLDLVNQVLGLTSLFETDPRSVYRSHANRLKNAGL